jgi:hypothetical protein
MFCTPLTTHHLLSAPTSFLRLLSIDSNSVFFVTRIPSCSRYSALFTRSHSGRGRDVLDRFADDDDEPDEGDGVDPLSRGLSRRRMRRRAERAAGVGGPDEGGIGFEDLGDDVAIIENLDERKGKQHHVVLWRVCTHVFPPRSWVPQSLGQRRPAVGLS